MNGIFNCWWFWYFPRRHPSQHYWHIFSWIRSFFSSFILSSHTISSPPCPNLPSTPHLALSSMSCLTPSSTLFPKPSSSCPIHPNQPSTPLNQLLYPAPSAQTVKILRSSSRMQGFLNLHWSTWTMSTESSRTSRKQLVPSRDGKWTLVYQKLWLSAITALMRDITLRIIRFRVLWTGWNAILSLRFEVF